jgi:drug/metabolite transporter (DMT)-like permease
LTAGQFLVTSLLCFVTCFCAPGGMRGLGPNVAFDILSHREVWLNLLLLSLFPTLGAFVLLNLYQPRIDPTRAALIYLIEPVVAAAWAWMAVGRKLGMLSLLGAALILLANVLVEVLAARGKRKRAKAEESVVLLD